MSESVFFLGVCLRFQFFICVYVKLADRVKKNYMHVDTSAVRNRYRNYWVVFFLHTQTSHTHSLSIHFYLFISAKCQSFFSIVYMNWVTHVHFTNPSQNTMVKKSKMKIEWFNLRFRIFILFTVLQKAFNSFDSQKTGSISTELVSDILRLMGQPFDKKILEELIEEVDEDSKWFLLLIKHEIYVRQHLSTINKHFDCECEIS